MYQVEPGDEALEQAAALPLEALTPLLEVWAVLAVAPWGGRSLKADNPHANILTHAFGPQRQGLVTYMILEDQRRVVVLQVAWLG